MDVNGFYKPTDTSGGTILGLLKGVENKPQTIFVGRSAATAIPEDQKWSWYPRSNWHIIQCRASKQHFRHNFRVRNLCPTKINGESTGLVPTIFRLRPAKLDQNMTQPYSAENMYLAWIVFQLNSLTMFLSIQQNNGFNISFNMFQLRTKKTAPQKNYKGLECNLPKGFTF